MVDAGLDLGAFVLAYLGLALLALRQRPHWRAVCARGERAQREGPSPARRSGLLYAGSASLLAGLGASWCADGPSFGSVLWVLALAISGVAVTCTLTWKPRWLACLIP